MFFVWFLINTIWGRKLSTKCREKKTNYRLKLLPLPQSCLRKEHNRRKRTQMMSTKIRRENDNWRQSSTEVSGQLVFAYFYPRQYQVVVPPSTRPTIPVGLGQPELGNKRLLIKSSHMMSWNYQNAQPSTKVIRKNTWLNSASADSPWTRLFLNTFIISVL